MDAEETLLYRRALSAYATGVALITVPNGADAVALTVNSFTSIALDPPLVLWSLGGASDRGVWFRQADRFVANILGAEDAELAARCARRGQYALPEDRIDRSGAGEPALAGALSRLWCRVVQQIPLGDHLAIVGEVTRFDGRDGDGLTYFRSRFGPIAAPQEIA